MAGTDETKEMYEPHEGSQGRDRLQAWGERHRHGVDESPDRAAQPAHQRPDRAPADASEGSLLAPRPAQAGRPPSSLSHLSPKARPGGLPGTDQGTGAAQVVPK